MDSALNAGLAPDAVRKSPGCSGQPGRRRVPGLASTPLIMILLSPCLARPGRWTSTLGARLGPTTWYRPTRRRCWPLSGFSATRDRNLGRPLVDSVQGSRHRNMKELRPGSTGRTEVRVLFAFDRERRAILLVGGDKSNDWSGWYKVNIPIADERYAEHQAQIVQRQTEKKAKADSTGRRSKGRKR